MSRGRNPSTVGRRKPKKPVELVGVLSTIATVLEAPRDRLGRLDIVYGSPAGDAREILRDMAIAFGVDGSADTMDQCAKVARAAITRADR
jgi:chloramphenicol 3-O-phosphotransferase